MRVKQKKKDEKWTLNENIYFLRNVKVGGSWWERLEGPQRIYEILNLSYFLNKIETPNFFFFKLSQQRIHFTLLFHDPFRTTADLTLMHARQQMHEIFEMEFFFST